MGGRSLEILSTTTHTIEYGIFIVASALMLLVLLMTAIAGIFEIFKYKNYGIETILITLGILIFTIILFIGCMFSVNDGARVTHDVIVTDWNKVYEQGYKVVKQKDSIITIQLKNKWGN